MLCLFCFDSFLHVQESMREMERPGLMVSHPSGFYYAVGTVKRGGGLQEGCVAPEGLVRLLQDLNTMPP